MKKDLVPAKTRLKKAESFLFSLHPRIFDWVDLAFNIPRIMDRGYLKRFFKKRYRSVLDIGSGKGSMTAFLLKYADRVTCLEKEAGELAILKKRFKGRLKNLVLAEGDARKLPFKKATFDLVFCNCVLEHIKDDEKVLAEASRCLKPGGFLIMTFPNKEMRAGYFKKRLFSQPRLRFLTDPAIGRYFSFKSLEKAEEWYAIYRWQHVRRGYSLEEIKKRLGDYQLRIEDSFYYPSLFLTEFWEIITFSRINRLFPYILFVLTPIFHLWPKAEGKYDQGLELAILAKKDK